MNDTWRKRLDRHTLNQATLGASVRSIRLLHAKHFRSRLSIRLGGGEDMEDIDEHCGSRQTSGQGVCSKVSSSATMSG